MSKKKEDESVQVKDTSRPARDAESMKQTTGMSQSEWEDIKSNGTPTDAQYEARYQSLLKRYNISPENYKTSKSGAAEYTEPTKKEPEPAKKETKTPPSKPEQKKVKIKPSPLKLQKKAEKTTPSKATGSPQTSNKSTKTPPKKETKESPKKETKESPKKETTSSNTKSSSYPKPAVEQIADSKTPVSFKYYKGKNMTGVKPISSFIKKNTEDGKRHMEERSKRRKADIMKYSPQSAPDTVKKKQGTVSANVVNDDIKYERKPLTINNPQTKKKSPIDAILEKEKKKFKYKQ